MFTGIITHTTKITAHRNGADFLTLTFQKPTSWTDLRLGESVSTNGVCLTVSAVRPDEYDCQLVPETLANSSFGHKLPLAVNLERSLGVNERFGGHFVQGHVDGVGKVVKIGKKRGWRLYIEFASDNQELVIYKGSIAVNGVSLTVAGVSANTLTVALIPHTLEHTTLSLLKGGDTVNLEFDMIGKYIVKFMERRDTHATGATS